jgi:hypothetical protein
MTFIELHHLYFSQNILRVIKPRRKGRAECGTGKEIVQDFSVEI